MNKPAGAAWGDYLLYDGECPVCARYVLWTNLRARHPGIRLIDAREHPDLVSVLRTDGVDVNDTMVLSVGGRRLVGAAAMREIERLMPKETLAQRAISATTRYEGALKTAYPLMVRGRKALLAMLGRSQIR